MSLLTIRAPRSSPVQFQAVARPRAFGQGDIADAVMGLATTALSIAAAERQAYLQKKQAEAMQKAVAAQQAAQLQAQQQAQQQAQLYAAAQLEAQRNAAAPAGLGLSVPGLGSLPSWTPWALLAALGAGIAASRLRRR